MNDFERKLARLGFVHKVNVVKLPPYELAKANHKEIFINQSILGEYSDLFMHALLFHELGHVARRHYPAFTVLTFLVGIAGSAGILLIDDLLLKAVWIYGIWALLGSIYLYTEFDANRFAESIVGPEAMQELLTEPRRPLESSTWERVVYIASDCAFPKEEKQKLLLQKKFIWLPYLSS